MTSAPLARLVLAALIAPATALADSPLTSTDWHLAYADVPAVVRAPAAQLDDATFAALRDPGTPFEVRGAIVSAIGWSLEGKPATVAAYRARLARATGTAEPSSAVDLFNLGFLMAFADYFHPSAALPLLERAARLEPDDEAVAMARALVAAQDLVESPARWCDVFRQADAVASRPWRTPMRRAAVVRIMDYMALYRDECGGPAAEPGEATPVQPASPPAR